MAEEGREGDDEEDGDGDEPAGGQVAEVLGEGAEFLDDFIVLDGDVDGEDEDRDADDVPRCGCMLSVYCAVLYCTVL